MEGPAISTNKLYNEINCPNCWYIITTKDIKDNFECPKCKRNAKELIELYKKYLKQINEDI